VRVARYARGEDYHLVLADRLEALVAWMRERQAEPFDAAIFVDKHHVQERVYARHAGLGWIGKNTCVINPEAGSWILLAGVATSVALAPDSPALDQCGDCTICLDACPTGALVEAHVLDATRCIAYLTIELEGPIPPDQRAHVGSHLFGCDICQEVCPWNQSPAVSPAAEWRPRRGLEQPSLVALWQASDAALEATVAGGPMTRATVAALRRNLAIAIGNSAGHLPPGLLDDVADPERASLREAGVTDAIQWARERLRAAEG
jgi:epoxyqueuosine reductase